MPLAEVLILKKDLNGARRVLVAGLKMDVPFHGDRRNVNCMRLLAEIAEAQGRTADALAYRATLPPVMTEPSELVALRSRAKAVPQDISIQLEYAAALEHAAEYGEAVEVCQAVLGLDQKNHDVAQMQARCRDGALRKLEATQKAAAKTPSIDLRALHAPG